MCFDDETETRNENKNETTEKTTVATVFMHNNKIHCLVKTAVEPNKQAIFEEGTRQNQALSRSELAIAFMLGACAIVVLDAPDGVIKSVGGEGWAHNFAKQAGPGFAELRERALTELKEAVDAVPFGTNEPLKDPLLGGLLDMKASESGAYRYQA